MFPMWLYSSPPTTNMEDTRFNSGCTTSPTAAASVFCPSNISSWLPLPYFIVVPLDKMWILGNVYFPSNCFILQPTIHPLLLSYNSFRWIESKDTATDYDFEETWLDSTLLPVLVLVALAPCCHQNNVVSRINNISMDFFPLHSPTNETELWETIKFLVCFVGDNESVATAAATTEQATTDSLGMWTSDTHFNSIYSPTVQSDFIHTEPPPSTRVGSDWRESRRCRVMRWMVVTDRPRYVACRHPPRAPFWTNDDLIRVSQKRIYRLTADCGADCEPV